MEKPAADRPQGQPGTPPSTTVRNNANSSAAALPPNPQPATPQPYTPRIAPECANCVAITFDDGPDTTMTNWLLRILKEKNAQATFFVTGANAFTHPKTLRRMNADGHTIGNHSYSHPELTKLTANQIASELSRTSDAVEKAIGRRPGWLRPPYGATNGTVATVAANQGMSQVLWNVDTLDWKHRDTEKTCRAAVDGAQAGSIILMHDIHAPTVAAAECVIDGLRAKGLELVNIDRLLGSSAPGKIYHSRP